MALNIPSKAHACGVTIWTFSTFSTTIWAMFLTKKHLVTLLWLFGLASPAGAQWLNYPTPGIPRLANGAPDLKAPAPRTPDGKPDFSGMWFANVPSRDFCREKDCIQEER